MEYHYAGLLDDNKQQEGIKAVEKKGQQEGEKGHV